MISVIVQRSPGDTMGPDIYDPLLCASAAALERGRCEIEAECSNRRVVALTGPYRQWIQPGVLVEVRGQRETFRAMARRAAITIRREGSEFKADISLELEREA